VTLANRQMLLASVENEPQLGLRCSADCDYRSRKAKIRNEKKVDVHSVNAVKFQYAGRRHLGQSSVRRVTRSAVAVERCRRHLCKCGGTHQPPRCLSQNALAVAGPLTRSGVVERVYSSSDSGRAGTK
jgi:hypothetical protein